MHEADCLGQDLSVIPAIYGQRKFLIGGKPLSPIADLLCFTKRAPMSTFKKYVLQTQVSHGVLVRDKCSEQTIAS